MLYKNDEIYRLTAQDINDIKKRYPKFPIRLTYPDHRIKPSRLKHNRLPDKPNSIAFPLLATVKTKSGTESWRYAENKINGPNGRVIYSPKNLVLRGSMSLQDTDMELLYWLMNCCPHLEGGKNFTGKVAKCVIEDLIGSAERKAMKEEEMATVKALIYSSKIGLGEDKLRTVAKAYFIRDVDSLTFAQVKLAVENEISRNKIDGIKKFNEMINAEQTMTVRANLSTAIDQGIITYMIQKKTWAWVTGPGKKNEPICQISAGADQYEALYDYYLGNRKFAQEITSALKGNKVIGFKDGENFEDEEEDEEQ